jgi:hypothetical protein
MKVTEDYYAEPMEEKKSNTTLIIIIVVVVLILLCCCCVVGFLLVPSLLGPAVGNVFSNVIEEMGVTPVP